MGIGFLFGTELMTKIFYPILIAILLLSGPTLAGAASSEALRLTLSQAVALALADNPDLALSRHRVQSAAVSVEAASGRFLPSLQGSISGNENFQHQAGSGESEEYHNANLQLSASLNLFNGFADRAGLEASRRQLQAADANLQRAHQTLAFSVASNYTAVLINAELVQVAEQNLRTQKSLEEQIEAFYQAGVRAIADLYQQQAASAQAEFSLIDARRNLQVAKLGLLQALGRNPGVTLEVLPADSLALSANLGEPDPAQAFDQALVTRPDLLAQQRQIAAARQQTRVARAGYLPSLDLQAASGSSYNSAGSGGSGGTFAGQLDDNRGSSLGLALSIPIFDRDQTRTNVAQAKIGETDAASTLLKLQQQIGLEVGQALADYQRARQQLTAADRQLDYARQALAASEARYQVGAATWVEFSSARTIFLQAQGDEVRVRYAVLLQGLNIGYARGDLESLLNLLSVQETSS